MGVVVDQRLDMSEGREVEVCYKGNDVVCYDELHHGSRRVRYHEDDFRGIWYKAIIEIRKPKPRSLIPSVRLLKDDFATPLAELSVKAFFRPIPPENLQARVVIGEGCVVDAYYNDAWWSGLLIKEIEDNKCLVFFDSPPDIVQFEKKHLRPHLDWVKKKTWIIPHFRLKLLRRLTEESIFSSGTMVEVSSKIDNMETVWVPAMVIKEEDDKKKYIVKFFDNKENATVDSQCVRATKKQVRFHQSDLRPPMEFEDGFWKITRESPLAQENRMNDSVMNGNSPWSDESVTLLNQEVAETQVNTPQPVRNQNGLAKDSPRENETSQENKRKRKREENLSLAANVVEETTKPNDTTIALPFVKNLPIWKTFESMEVFTKFPQSPHFSPLVDVSENSREMFAVGMMFTFSTLLEELKLLRLSSSVTELIKISNSLCELGKHGFDVKEHHSRIHKVFAFRARLSEKKDERESTEKKIAEKVSKKVEIRRKILELELLEEDIDEEIEKMKSCTATIDKEIEEMELEFQTTVLDPL